MLLISNPSVFSLLPQRYKILLNIATQNIMTLLEQEMDTYISACVGEDRASMEASCLGHVGQSSQIRSVTGVPGQKDTQVLRPQDPLYQYLLCFITYIDPGQTKEWNQFHVPFQGTNMCFFGFFLSLLGKHQNYGKNQMCSLVGRCADINMAILPAFPQSTSYNDKDTRRKSIRHNQTF